jgi:hypothetical protein
MQSHLFLLLFLLLNYHANYLSNLCTNFSIMAVRYLAIQHSNLNLKYLKVMQFISIHKLTNPATFPHLPVSLRI